MFVSNNIIAHLFFKSETNPKVSSIDHLSYGTEEEKVYKAISQDIIFQKGPCMNFHPCPKKIAVFPKIRL